MKNGEIIIKSLNPIYNLIISIKKVYRDTGEELSNYELLKALNVLEAHQEDLENVLNGSANFECDTIDKVLECNNFYTNYEELLQWYLDNELSEDTLKKDMFERTVKKVTDGYVELNIV